MSDQHEDISEEDGGDNDTSDLGSASLEGGDQDSSNEEDEVQDRSANAAGGLGFSDMESEVPSEDDDDPPAPTFSSIPALQNGSSAQNTGQFVNPSSVDSAHELNLSIWSWHFCVSGRYVPPALRAKQSQGTDAIKSEAQIKLGRQVKGLLNKCVCSATRQGFLRC